MKTTTNSNLSILIFSAFLLVAVNSQATPEPEDTIQDRYRIEIILFQLLESNGVGRTTKTPNQYAEPLVEFDFTEQLEEPEITHPDELVIELEPLPQSEAMANAWKRLRSSREFRPLIYQQWQVDRADTVARAATGGVKGMNQRIHDEKVLFTPPVSNLSDIPNPITAESLVPPDLSIYQLDGTAAFNQGRFLHIALDFEFREKLLDSQPIITNIESVETTPTYMIFKLHQSRQIIPLRLEFFDNEKFGALVYIEEVTQPKLVNNTEN